MLQSSLHGGQIFAPAISAPTAHLEYRVSFSCVSVIIWITITDDNVFLNYYI
jgi:hypothetical protein